jgi:HEPN domain-containing protein
MKFAVPFKCSCGKEFSIACYAEEKLSTAKCPGCDTHGIAVEALSISPSAVRLLFRSKSEMENGDYTISIICSAIAVESFLTRAFLKWKGVENIGVAGHLPTEAEEAVWEKDFPKTGGFPRPADFVSEALAGIKFNDYVTNNPAAFALISALPNSDGKTPIDYFKAELFERRNRIMHWGKLNYQREDAEICLNAANAIIEILKSMDYRRYEKMESDWRQANS